MKRLLLALALILPDCAFADKRDTPTVFVSASPTCDTSAYATGELIGGKLTFSYATQEKAGTGYIVSVAVMDLSAQAVDMDLVLFGANPAATTFTDQAAFDIADADASKVIAVINLGSSSRFAFADNGVKFLSGLSIPVRSIDSNNANTQTIYGALVSRGTPTFAAATDVKITLAILQD